MLTSCFSRETLLTDTCKGSRLQQFEIGTIAKVHAIATDVRVKRLMSFVEAVVIKARMERVRTAKRQWFSRSRKVAK